MARTKMPTQERKRRMVSVRLTDQEYQKVKGAAGGRTYMMAAVIRKALETISIA